AIVTVVTVPSRDGIVLLQVPTTFLSASRTVLNYGLETTLQVSVAPIAAGDVRLLRRPAGSVSWSPVAVISTDSNGIGRLACSPSVTTEYRAIDVRSGVASKTVKVVSRPVVAIRASSRSVHALSAVLVSGAVSPRGHAHLSLQRFVGGHWRTVKAFVSATGGFASRITMSTRGTFSYRVYVAADAGHVSATSEVVRVTFR
ncbi:MAG TPA: hypothetical protein VIK83_02255, partial [Coriobacteriia bacterium]